HPGVPAPPGLVAAAPDLRRGGGREPARARRTGLADRAGGRRAQPPAPRRRPLTRPPPHPTTPRPPGLKRFGRYFARADVLRGIAAAPQVSLHPVRAPVSTLAVHVLQWYRKYLVLAVSLM